MEQVFMYWGSWGWIGIGLVLLTLEILVPGVFMLWFGIAALLVGFVSVIIGSSEYWSSETQIVVFLFLSVISAYYGRKYLQKNGASDQPLLNQPSLQLVGRSTILKEPIINGYGRAEFDGSFWKISGPDMASGSKITVVSALNGTTLIVEATQI
jgi:inner membrane protein